MRRLRLLIADDHLLVCRGLSQLLQAAFGGAQIDDVQDVGAMLKVIRQARYDAAIMDLAMPGNEGMIGISLVRRICPSMPLLILSMYPEERLARRALLAGANGYMTKRKAPEDLITAVKTVLGGESYLSASLALKLAKDLLGAGPDLPHERLSPQEYRVMCLLGAGRTVGEIAQAFHLSVKTISSHRANLLRKVGLANNAELMRYCIENSLV